MAYTAGKSQAGYEKRDTFEREHFWHNGTNGFQDEEGPAFNDGSDEDVLDLQLCATPDCSEELAEHGDEIVVLDPETMKEIGFGSQFMSSLSSSSSPSMSVATTTAEADAIVLERPTPALGAERAMPSPAQPTG